MSYTQLNSNAMSSIWYELSQGSHATHIKQFVYYQQQQNFPSLMAEYIRRNPGLTTIGQYNEQAKRIAALENDLTQTKRLVDINDTLITLTSLSVIMIVLSRM